MTSGVADPTLARIVTLCSALPEKSRSGEQHTKFAVRDRTFA
jgi:hypothetical protein